jgi:hypothetical protein
MLAGVLLDVDMRCSTILLIALIPGVLLDVPLTVLLLQIFRTAAAGSARAARSALRISGSLRALVL